MVIKVILLSVLSILALIEDTHSQCISDGYVNGCSIPLNVHFYYKKEFTTACNKHDVCYFCGQKYGWTRSQCDLAFKRDMEKSCVEHLGKKKRSFWHVSSEIVKLVAMRDGLEKCRQAAKVYYLSVHYYGDDNFVNSSPSWCNDPCAKENGSPN